ncbi:hypothetical protein SCHPADRAFT_436044 [Schizopora paradoxa]|uniref:Secreted protein n=1 Tax=Schizopora paradoxa TaxID=27342 RepID=A0A0H2RJU4_9AGAM|nr:hypothetical protein SCHPADRAFT_436044 [Schizopora paradoxa]
MYMTGLLSLLVFFLQFFLYQLRVIAHSSPPPLCPLQHSARQPWRFYERNNVYRPRELASLRERYKVGGASEANRFSTSRNQRFRHSTEWFQALVY